MHSNDDILCHWQLISISVTSFCSNWSDGRITHSLINTFFLWFLMSLLIPLLQAASIIIKSCGYIRLQPSALIKRQMSLTGFHLTLNTAPWTVPEEGKCFIFWFFPHRVWQDFGRWIGWGTGKWEQYLKQPNLGEGQPPTFFFKRKKNGAKPEQWIYRGNSGEND